jgi:purine-binding chemotaxis protein CheW
MIESARTIHDTKTEGVGVFKNYCTFWLGNGLFAAEASLVKEVAVMPFLTPIPQSPAPVRGYVNLRGQIVLVLDLKCILMKSATQIGDDTRLVVFRSSLGDPFGILVDRISDIVSLNENRIEKCATGIYTNDGENRTPEGELITGIGKLADNLLSILDARKILPHIEKAIARCRTTPLNQE